MATELHNRYLTHDRQIKALFYTCLRAIGSETLLYEVNGRNI
jgi:hypothetical protein